MIRSQPPLRVLIVGGSLGGLTAALRLAEAGCDVEVFERARAPLEGRGAGIVLHPATVRYAVERGRVPLQRVGAPARVVSFLARDGSVDYEEPCFYRFTSYNALYRVLLDALDPHRYHLGSEVVGFEVADARVVVRLADGEEERGDLLVGADGITSLVRRRSLPDLQPEYAGYVGWRGTANEADLDPAMFSILHEAITYHVLSDGHFLAYPIPNHEGSLEPGRRLVNWLWYRNVPAGEAFESLMTDREGAVRPVSLPPGAVRDEYLWGLREAARVRLPEVLAETVRRTSQPFVQAVYDLGVPRMAFDRVCLIGDAAFAVRPHAAAGTAKAAEDATTLAEAIAATEGNVDEALQAWEPTRLELGRRVLRRAREIGKRAQFLGTFRPGDPSLRFGLHHPGDSFLTTDR